MPRPLYLYGLVHAPGPRHFTVTGLDNQPVQIQVMPPFAILYSLAQQDRYLASRANLLAHETVLEKAMLEGYRAMLPLQFGLVVQSWEQVQEDLLSPKQQALQDLLQVLEGKREVGVKVFWDPAQELQLGLEEHPDLKQRRDAMVGAPLGLDAVVQIGHELEQLLERRRSQIAQTFMQALGLLSSDQVTGDLLTENMAFNGSFLIPWEEEPRFSRKVEELDQQFQGRLRIRYNNLSAPYNFARL
ncbi:MAG: GvpL/GvpF family gas vesicle protein [Synechococcaceae cyanobacterium SM2_3_1]|nr:GvpL/GvpF family gas vesicle protein [Synechococcaceae cyanobacterium SM2_3_1]